jgi:hypothetical protein
MDFIDMLSKTVVGLAQAKKGLANFIDEEIAEHKRRQIERSQEARMELIKRLKELEKEKNKHKNIEQVIDIFKKDLDNSNITKTHIELLDETISIINKKEP